MEYVAQERDRFLNPEGHRAFPVRAPPRPREKRGVLRLRGRLTGAECLERAKRRRKVRREEDVRRINENYTVAWRSERYAGGGRRSMDAPSSASFPTVLRTAPIYDLRHKAFPSDRHPL